MKQGIALFLLCLLEKENQYLKKLLSDAGISYFEKETDDIVHEFDPNQGARIIPGNITETHAKMFFRMFWGRTDVYSKRTIKKSTGEVNYYTQCHNFWKNGCPRITGSKIKCQDCPKQAYKESAGSGRRKTASHEQSWAAVFQLSIMSGC